MDILEGSNLDFLLSRRVRKKIAWALLIGVAWVPPVRSWYLGQIQHHGEHLGREIMSRILPAAPDPTPPKPIKPAGESRDPVRPPAS